jgi:hypothetical protein
MSKKSPTKEIKLMTIEEVDFNLPEVEPSIKNKNENVDKKGKKQKKINKYLEEEEAKEKKEKKTNRIKR